jgi:predicted ATPase
MENNTPEMLVETFVIKGLHGYKDVSIEFVGPATIVVAENGTGKTTVLNMLNAFLTRRFHRLAAFSFTSIECKFKGELLPLVLNRSMLSESATPETDEMLRQVFESSSLSQSELLDFLNNTYKPGDFSTFQSHRIVRQIYFNTSRNYDGVEKLLDSLHASLDRSLSEEARRVSAEVRRCVGKTEVLFLPTYRRIERPQLRPRQNLGRPAPIHGPANRTSRYDDIVFGLADVEDMLADLSDEIERRSNLGYRSLSARILDEMLKGSAIKESVSIADLPDVKSLSRFLSRVGRTENRLGAVFADIENLYETRAIEHSDNWFLRYFLSRLARVIDETREMEQKVEQFVTVCNSYLTLSSDEKQLSFDPQTLRVVVKDLWAQRAIGLDALSSGEKQIISLMARLYLNQNPKIVLIDEPELSLSLDWQRKVLPDTMNSGTVVQMLAITHSPFVFENELDSCARALHIQRSEGGNA